ncbi:hypothetical protein E2542_SST21620 [Spatholobus suberectus]|nr:hypothetical protein E2542_SST21620 [Spatholobus suberectus]
MVRAAKHAERYIFPTELIEGVKLAAHNNWSSIIIESDCKRVVDINRNVTDWSELGVIYEDIRLAQSLLDECVFNYVSRKGTEAAHKSRQNWHNSRLKVWLGGLYLQPSLVMY